MEYKSRTSEEVQLWRTATKIIDFVKEEVFEHMPEVNAHSWGVKYINSHVEIEFGLAVDFARQELAVVLHLDDEPQVIAEFMREQLRRLYKEMITKQDETKDEKTN
jgi:hypothetical protein